jgi:hypothetical protein
MGRADRQRRYNRLRTEAPSTVQRLELGMLAAAILTYDLGRTGARPCGRLAKPQPT